METLEVKIATRLQAHDLSTTSYKDWVLIDGHVPAFRLPSSTEVRPTTDPLFDWNWKTVEQAIRQLNWSRVESYYNVRIFLIMERNPN